MPAFKRLRHLAHDREVGMAQVVLDPEGPGVARVFLIPPKPSLRAHDSLLVINSQWVLTVSRSWAFLLQTFFQQLAEDAVVGKEIDPAMMSIIIFKTALKMKNAYPEVSLERFQRDLDEVVSIILAVARGQDVPPGVFQGNTLAEYAEHLRGPLRMDLLVSPMQSGGIRDCPLHCGICYANGQPLMNVAHPLMTHEWKKVIDICLRACIPELTFTGGDPLTRDDIVQLVEYAQVHQTRLNTSGVLLTPKLAAELYAAKLDTIQITLYSDRMSVHDQLVGQPGAWHLTVSGIKAAIEAGLFTSVNTPLLLANSDYAATLRFLKELGVRYVSCSGLIPTGSATKQISLGAAMSQAELYETLARAVEVARELEMELNFTSPGALTDEQLKELGLQRPVCGACLDNMAVTPGGKVVFCQSALRGPEDVLGDILNDPWHHIWNSRKCREMRKMSAGKNICPLGGVR